MAPEATTMNPTLDYPSFRFTEDRIEVALRLMQKPDAPNRKMWRDESGDGLHLRAGKSGGTYYWIAKREGKKLRERIGDATRMKLTAARNAAKRMAGGDMAAKPKAIRVRTDGPRVAEVWDAYNEASLAGTFFTGRKPPKPSTLKSYNENWQPHVGRPYGSKSLAQLAKAVPKIHESLAGKPATQKRVMQIIHNVYLFARKKKWWSEADPTIDQDSGKAIKCKAVKARARVLQLEELERLMNAAAVEPFPWNIYFPMLFLTSVRMSTLRQMRWDEIDFRHKPALWQIPTTKNDDPLTLTLSEPALDMLKELKPNKKKSDWVFPMAGDPSRCIADVDHAWARVTKAAKLKDARIHDLRRSAATYALRSGMSLPAVQKAGGWRTLNAVAVYARAEIQDAQKAASAVADIFSSLDK